ADLYCCRRETATEIRPAGASACRRCRARGGVRGPLRGEGDALGGDDGRASDREARDQHLALGFATPDDPWPELWRLESALFPADSAVFRLPFGAGCRNGESRPECPPDGERSVAGL